jgi:DHA2 family multidrug resistance protein-like MFS transporter
VGTLATDLVIGAAPPERAGAASALSETGAELGGSLGIAILGSIGLAVYRSSVQDTLPDGLTSGQQDAATRTLADAAATGHHLAQPIADELVQVASNAFTYSLHYIAVVATGATLLLAVLGSFVLRRSSRAAGHV